MRESRLGCGVAVSIGCALALGCSGATEGEKSAPTGGQTSAESAGAAGQPNGAGAASAGSTMNGGTTGLSVSAELDGTALVFDQGVRAFNSRAPMIEIWGSLGDEHHFSSLRIMVIPRTGSIVPGDYRCQDGSVVLYNTERRYETTQPPGECSIHVDEAGLDIGEVFAGTFSAQVFSVGGEPTSTTISGGEFRAIVE